ncbi:hypothetical protein nACB2_067 [Acinetobacter phage nACB2]|nr:hypothetical protein nACB2_067 [Acinetobacter phage nACB2]
MADFCACCAVKHLHIEPEMNDLNREPEMDDSEIDFNFLVYNDLCEGCGWVTVDQKGFPANFQNYNIHSGQDVIHIGKDKPYKIIALANNTTLNYPHMVVYEDDMGAVYTRWLPVFIRKFKPKDGNWYFKDELELNPELFISP